MPDVITSLPPVWDKTAVALLKTMYAEGYSSGMIAKRLNELGYAFTRNAIIGKKNRLQLPPPPSEAVQKKLKAQRQILHGKIAVSRPKFVFHRRPQPLGAQAMEVGMLDKPYGNNAILLTQSGDGECRAIIGYENGELSKAIICGDPTPIKIVKGKAVRGSWCQYHNELYTQEDRPRR